MSWTPKIDLNKVGFGNKPQQVYTGRYNFVIYFSNRIITRKHYDLFSLIMDMNSENLDVDNIIKIERLNKVK